MVSPRQSAKTRRRIAGERSRLSGPAVLARPESAPEPARPEAAPEPARSESPRSESPRSEAVPGPVRSEPDRPEPARSESAVAERAEEPGEKTAGGPPRWVLGLLAGLLLIALVLDGVVVWRELDQRSAQENSARALHSATVQAPVAAEQAAEALLSFRHDTLDRDIADAERFASDNFRPKYVASVRDVVSEPAADVRAVVEANVLSSGVVEAGAQRSDVLLFVNQTTTKTTSDQPSTALNRTVFTMIRQGDGWAVDEIKAL